MSILKATVIFISVYVALTMVGVSINYLLNLHPQITVNIACTVLAALSIRNKINLNTLYPYELLFFSALGGVITVLSIFLLSFIYTNFSAPSLLEALTSFLVNAIAVYITIYFSVLRES